MPSLPELRSTIDKADQSYYYGTPLLTDAQYDSLKEQLRKLSPKDERFARVGAPVPKDTMLKKVKHSIPMGSLEKCDTVEELGTWYDKHIKGQNRKLVASLKIDGASLALYYKQGKLTQAVTRGGDDGVGEDVTANAIRFQGVPTELPQPFTGAIRGECVLLVADWLKIDPDQDGNPRNIGNGTMRRGDGTDSDKLSFYAFDLALPEDLNGWFKVKLFTETDKMLFLASLGFTVVPFSPCKDLKAVVTYYEQTMAGRDKLACWADGVVISADDLQTQDELGQVHNRPKGRRVLKFPAEGAVTTLESVVLTIGHTGAIIPTGKVATVRIGGTNVSSVLLNNFEEIAALGLVVGAKVRVIKAKDIIPKIVEVLERPAGVPDMAVPTECPACGTRLRRAENVGGDEGAHIHCGNVACPGRVSALLNTWIKKQNILGIGDEVLAGLIKSGVTTPAQLYTLRAEGIANLPVGNGRLGDKRAATIVANIAATRTMTLDNFLGSLGVPYLGRRRVQLIRKACPGEFDCVADWLSGKLLKEEWRSQASIQNVAPRIVAGIEAVRDLIKQLLKHITIEEKKETKPMASSSGKLTGKTFVFTGKIERVGTDGKRFTRDMMHDLVQQNGGSVADSVRPGVTTLVQADPTSQSSKTQKAKQLGVEIMSEENFFKLVGV